MDKEFRFLSVFTGIFVASWIIAAVTATKIIALGPINIPAGTLVFPITFILNDILTEAYGYARSRRVVWTALGCQVLALIIFFIADILPPAPFWQNQEAFHQIIGFAPRIAIAGIIALFCGEFANSFVLSKMKYKEEGKRGWKQGWRFVASTAVGEGVDSILVMILAFGGLLATRDLLTTMVTLYLVKVAYEIIALPISIPLSNLIKRVENIDKIDTPQNTNYNPFAVASK
jgi:queuosine precursor transporter